MRPCAARAAGRARAARARRARAVVARVHGVTVEERAEQRRVARQRPERPRRRARAGGAPRRRAARRAPRRRAPCARRSPTRARACGRARARPRAAAAARARPRTWRRRREQHAVEQRALGAREKRREPLGPFQDERGLLARKLRERRGQGFGSARARRDPHPRHRPARAATRGTPTSTRGAARLGRERTGELERERAPKQPIRPGRNADRAAPGRGVGAPAPLRRRLALARAALCSSSGMK